MYTATTPNGVKVELLTSETETLTAQVFKTIVDPFVGRISYLKVLSGVLNSDSTLVNANNGKPEKISSRSISLKENIKQRLVNYSPEILVLW